MSQAHRHPGFAIVPNVLSRLDADELVACLEPQRRTRAGARHLMSLPVVSAVAADRRMVAIATEQLGGPAIPFRATLFDKAPGSNWLVAWHQDRALPLMQRLDAPGWGPWSLKGGVQYAQAPVDALERIVALRLSLDDSGEDNGPLRVLPGTASRGLLTDAQVAALAQEIAPVACCVDTGGVVAMRPLIVHASSKAVSNRPRRVLHIEYAESVDVGSGLRLAIV
jgi:ectoine hydroxylase-related dioxygenase (phytanoyl-CoA dioxygenase family)